MVDAFVLYEVRAEAEETVDYQAWLPWLTRLLCVRYALRQKKWSSTEHGCHGCRVLCEVSAEAEKQLRAIKHSRTRLQHSETRD
jgi:hypothetical protein